MVSTDSRVWVGCLASYNGGRLHGEWVAASDIRAGIERVLASSPESGAEEWFVADYDEFPNLGEYPSIEDVERISELLARASNIPAMVAYVGAEGREYAVERAESFEEKYRGCYESLADYAQEMFEDCYADCLKGLPPVLRYAIDWEAVGRECVMAGDIETLDAGGGDVWVFEVH